MLSEVTPETHANYDPAAEAYLRVQAPTVRFTGDRPPYYSFPQGATVASLRSRLETMFVNDLPLDYSDYESQIFDLPADPEFDQLK